MKQPILLILAALILTISTKFILPATLTNKNDTFNPFKGINRTKQDVQVVNTSKNIPVLMYHYVEYNKDKRDYLRESLNIQPHIFEQQVVTLKNAGYTFITPSEINSAFNKEGKYVILSFDDGYADFHEYVLPILKKHNVKAVNYIISGFIGLPNYMSKEEIKECIASELVEIGSHTVNHADLPGAKTANAVFELSYSKKTLEDVFNIKVVSFAYPHGFFDTQSKFLVKQAGYLNAVTTNKGNTIKAGDMFEIPRIRPGYHVDEELTQLLQ